MKKGIFSIVFGTVVEQGIRGHSQYCSARMLPPAIVVKEKGTLYFKGKPECPLIGSLSPYWFPVPLLVPCPLIGSLHVNGRIYGYHSESARLYPLSGPGIVSLSPNEFRALIKLKEFADDIPRAEKILSDMLSKVTPADIAAAKKVLGL